ncbi:MAG TPA: PASTA domain-containing protein, partial [Candidatus Kapabacteria bacterium]|nr:PASTA domain-containing protein [Candidatus Kapabacteria bacterium]
SIKVKNIENNANDTVYVPNIQGLEFSEAEKILQELGLRYSTTEKQGIVKQVFPEPGRRILRSTVIKLETAPAKTDNEKMPSVVGLPLRRAITILHTAGIKVQVRGSGKVVRQVWERTNGELTCTLFASP